jgi:putative colanic acid biosynthesis acetyltransferase WcaF
MWDLVWSLFCSWTPKPLNPWRIFVLRFFGATIYGKPFVHQRARPLYPWNIELHHLSSIGDGAVLYALGKIVILSESTIAQEAYLCTGTHAFHLEKRNLTTAPITIGANAFVGARAFILPGITIGPGVIVGACSVVTKDLPIGIYGGNPARLLNKSK